ncbi:hypothetical protein L1987_38100 [Smallanthus sonchifolius]|uniref:Uncharacterized protein n=1 Tax=Smallanthus sonchifolius TaxID=185202 RepID=A0ACB9HJL5_9ASTR|nr:hypothetical protein L1987_38100 [Smallanthus sonchifolius]
MDKPPTSYFNGNRSFSDTLLGRQGVLKVGKTVAVEDHANALSGLHGRALVVRMIDLDVLKSIYILLNDLCPGKGKVQYIGGLSVINAIGSSVGKVVFNPNRPDEDDDLSYDYMGVLVGDDTATEDCEVNVDTPMHEGNVVIEPVVDTPEKDTLSGTEDSVTGKPGMETIKDINEGINFPIIDNNCGGETPIILEDLSEKQDFIPGNVFDFDADCHTDGVLDGNGPNINKRKKKGGLGSVGQINPAYSSSLEKSKVGKKHRLEEDVFGLDQLLGLDKDKEPFSSAYGDPQDLDLNSQPCIEPLTEHFSVDLDRSNRSEFSSIFQATEVEATIAMGERLVADLSKSHDMIQDSINKWAKISDRLQCVDNVKQLSWEWKSVPSTHQQVVELFDLLNNIHNLEWRGGVDCWKWTEDKDGQFTVASAKRLMSSNSLGDGSLGIRWKVRKSTPIVEISEALAIRLLRDCLKYCLRKVILNIKDDAPREVAKRLREGDELCKGRETPMSSERIWQVTFIYERCKSRKLNTPLVLALKMGLMDMVWGFMQCAQQTNTNLHTGETGDQQVQEFFLAPSKEGHGRNGLEVAIDKKDVEVVLLFWNNAPRETVTSLCKYRREVLHQDVLKDPKSDRLNFDMFEEEKGRWASIEIDSQRGTLKFLVTQNSSHFII